VGALKPKDVQDNQRHLAVLKDADKPAICTGKQVKPLSDHASKTNRA
jgi:hypothetical protein